MRCVPPVSPVPRCEVGTAVRCVYIGMSLVQLYVYKNVFASFGRLASPPPPETPYYWMAALLRRHEAPSGRYSAAAINGRLTLGLQTFLHVLRPLWKSFNLTH